MVLLKVFISFVFALSVNSFFFCQAFSQGEEPPLQKMPVAEQEAAGGNQPPQAGNNGQKTGEEAQKANEGSLQPQPILKIKPVEGKNLYSIELRNVELKDFFRAVAHNYNLNFLIDKDVTGKVTASFTNISLKEALDKIASMNNLILEKSGDTTIIKPNLITKIFVLKHIEAKSLLETSAITEEGNSSGDSSSSSAGTAGAGASSEASSSAGGSEMSGMSKGSSQQTGKAATIYDFLSDKGKIYLGGQPNSIMVVDYPENVKRIEAYLKMVDKAMTSKIFKLKYISAKEIVGEAGSSTEGASGASGGGSSAGGGTGSSLGSSDSSSSSSYSKVASDIKSLLSSKGKILFGNEPNSILVIDYPENIKRIGEYLKMVDVPPRQVLIEARIVEVRLQGENSLGVNWSAFADKGGLKIGQYRLTGGTFEKSIAPATVTETINGISRDVTYPSYTGYTRTKYLEQGIPYKPTYYPPGQTNEGEESPFTIGIFDENINIVLKMLANSYNTNILSAPQVTTVNNREAEMKIVQRYPWAEPEASTDQNGNVTVTWTIHYEEIGIVLKVTPMINDDGMITMILEPEVSEKVGDLNLVTSGVTYKVPIIDKRSASTKVMIGNGDTLIIGGLIKEDNTKGVTKVPFFGDIPGLGWLFKSKKDTKDKTELLVFVSPTIITPGVVANMERREKSGIGKWYMDERKKREEALDKAKAASLKAGSPVLVDKTISSKEELNVSYDHLEKMYESLKEKREKLEKIISEEKQ